MKNREMNRHNKHTERRKWLDGCYKKEQQARKRLEVARQALTGIVGIEVKEEAEDEMQARTPRTPPGQWKTKGEHAPKKQIEGQSTVEQEQ
jgi:hypothetical protein